MGRNKFWMLFSFRKSYKYNIKELVLAKDKSDYKNIFV